jgi:YHS domain-containing protein
MACSQTVTPGLKADSVIIRRQDEKINRVGADGYDVTSYFEIDSAVKGNSQIAAVYKGFKWYFSSEENKEKFLANAEKYIPGFKEYCVNSLAKGKLISGKPKFHKVYKEKLYFFYSQEYADEFEQDPENFLKDANKKWKEFQNQIQ